MAPKNPSTLIPFNAVLEFHEAFNATHPLIDIAGHKYEPSYALEKLDPIAFRQELNYFLDNLLEAQEIIEIAGKYYINEDVEPA